MFKSRLNRRLLALVQLKGESGKNQVYWIMPEALANALKYARPNRITLRLQKTARGDLTISVEDDGLEIPGTVHEDGRVHSGLTHMKERASLIGADLSIQSIPGLGTTVSLNIRCEDGHPTAAPD